jgi:membrane protease YdiL (CAAX protease family)
MSENTPALPLAPDTPSTDLQLPPAASGIAPAPPDLDLPVRSLVREPRWPHPNLGWSFLWCLLFMFVTQVPGAVIAVVVVLVLAALSPDTLPLETLRKPADLLKSEAMNVALGIAFFITELIVIGFSWLIIRLVVGRDWKRQLALKIPGLAHTLLALASLPALVLLGNIAYEILRKILHVPSLADFGLTGMEEMVQVFSKWPWHFAVLVIGLGPGIGEELWCRGFLGRGLVGNYGVVFGVFATSFFFGFIHLDPCQGAMAMLMGVWLHFVYLTTRSLLLPMMLHTLNNSLAVLDTRLPQLAVIETKPSDIPIIVYTAALFLLAATAFALYQSRARLAAKTPDQLLLWRPEFDGVAYPPEDSGMTIVHPAPSLTATALAALSFVLFVLACAAWLSAT